MRTVNIPYGNSSIAVKIPERWLGEIIQPHEQQPQAEMSRLIQNALDHPIGSPRLEHLIRLGQRVVILVDDHTRKTPTRQILPQVLERLHSTGFRQEDICIFIALGSHRRMSPAEVETKIGAEISNRYEVINSGNSNLENMEFLGVTSNGIPLRIHRSVASADIRIGLGMITPHMDAGFSGGAKILLPGACSNQTLDAFHIRAAYLQGNPLGDADTTLRLDLEQAVAERVPLDFIVNTIPTLSGGVFQCVAGHPVKAHRVGVIYAQQALGAPTRQRYPVVIAGCYPYEHDLWQSMKGLWCGDLLTADGGSLILLSHASEGCQGTPLLPEYIGTDPDCLKHMLDYGTAEDPKSVATGILVGHMKQRINISLVSVGLTRTEASKMGLRHYNTADEAIKQSVGQLQQAERQGSIGVLPYAGLVLPIFGSPTQP